MGLLMNKKYAAVLIGFLLVAVNASAFTITGDISSWQKEDFISFDEVGDCAASCGDITSVFAWIDNKTPSLRISLYSMKVNGQDYATKQVILMK